MFPKLSTTSKEMIIIMVTEAMEVRQLLFTDKIVEALAKSEDILNKYIMLKSHIKMNNNQEKQVLTTIAEGFKLLKKVLEVNLGSKISRTAMLQFKTLLKEACNRKEFLHLYRLASERTSMVFQIKGYYQMARVAIILTIEAYKEINLNKNIEKKFFDKLDIQISGTDASLRAACLSGELHYLIFLLTSCSKKRLISGYEPKPNDEIFCNLLSEMELKDHYELPVFINTSQDAKKLHRMITTRIADFKKNCEVNPLAPANVRGLMEIHFWEGEVLSAMCFYECDTDIRCEMMRESIKHLEGFKDRYKLAVMSKLGFPESSGLKELYCKLMDANITNYGMLAEIKTKSLLDSSPQDAKHNIKTIDVLLKNMLTELEEFMEFLDADQKTTEMQKFGYYMIFILYYRSLGSSSKTEQDVNFNKSVVYIKRWLKAIKINPILKTLSIISILNGFEFTGINEQEDIKKVAKRIDEDPYIAKFRPVYLI